MLRFRFPETGGQAIRPIGRIWRSPRFSMSANRRPIQRRHMLLEEGALRFRRCREAPAGKARHDLAQRRRMILRLEIVLDPLDAERGEIVAQARQRTLVEKAGQIVGRRRATARHARDRRTDRNIRARLWLCASDAASASAAWARPSGVASPPNCAISPSNAFDGAARKQCGKQRIFLGARRIDGIEGIIFHGGLAVEIGTKLFARNAGRGFNR